MEEARYHASFNTSESNLSEYCALEMVVTRFLTPSKCQATVKARARVGYDSTLMQVFHETGADCFQMH